MSPANKPERCDGSGLGGGSISWNQAAETHQGSVHLESLLMTRMRAPFSSFSRWLSDLSSVRIWESGRKQEVRPGSFIIHPWVVSHKQTVYGVKTAMQSCSGAPRTVLYDMHYRTPSCRTRGGRGESQGEKLADQSQIWVMRLSRSWTKNNTRLKYFPSRGDKQ